jgi:probable rRNA maturation factor
VDPDSKRQPSRHQRRPGGRGGALARRLTVAISDGRGRPVADGGLARWLAAVAPARARGEVAVALVSDAHVRKLNRVYRHKDAATDVLSFPADGLRMSRSSAPELGDIVIATGVAKRQAHDAGHPYNTELRVLALHGLLHLLGFDHHDRNDNGRMERAEARLRRKGGLAAGLIERARP